MKKYSPWIHLQVINFAQSENQKIHGEDMRIVMSPNYFPGAARMVLEEDSKKVIEFEYVGSEPMALGRFSEGVEISYGKISKKIFSLRFLSESKQDGQYIKTAQHAINKYLNIQKQYSNEQSELIAHCKIVENTIQENFKKMRSSNFD